MVFQYPEYQLFEETVRQDVAFGPKNLGLPQDEIDRRVRSAMEKIDDLEINSSWWDNLEVLEAGVHKGAAVRALAERLNLPMEQVMAIGDSGNDAAMLDFAGVGVAMGNGEEALKQKADLIAPTNEEGGVADMLELAIKGEI